MCQFPSVFLSLLHNLCLLYFLLIYDLWMLICFIRWSSHIRWDSHQVIWHMVMSLLFLGITEGYEEVMKIYRLISYRLEFVSYPILFPIILKNITQHNSTKICLQAISLPFCIGKFIIWKPTSKYKGNCIQEIYPKMKQTESSYVTKLQMI